MNSNKVLYFLGLLKRETSGHADELAEIYQRALDEHDDIIHLKMLMSECIYYGEIGNSMYKKGEKIIEDVYKMPTKALEFLPLLKQVHESMDNELIICEKLMRSPWPFSEAITLLKKRDTIAYMVALKKIASTCVYLMAIYEGIESIKNLTWDDNVGLQEMIYSVNTRFLPSLCSIKRPNYSWVIRKKRMGGRALFDGNCFYLNYENTKSVEVMCAALHKEPIGTHAFLNLDAYESGEIDVPFCWGIGNIVSVTPDNALLFLKNNITTKVRSPQAMDLKQKTPAPYECVSQLTNGTMFCITPDELLLAMNQWEVGYEIEEHKRTHNCLFCGKYVDGNRLVCSSHLARGSDNEK